MTVVIRRAVAADRTAVEAIVEAAYAPYIDRIGRKPGPMIDDYRAMIDDGRVYVLLDGGAVRGLVVLVPEPETMLLDNVAVDPAARGRGYGRMLLEFAEERARAAGCAAIRLYTNEAMIENVALYARIGYVETHRGAEKGFRRIYMTKPLI